MSAARQALLDGQCTSGAPTAHGPWNWQQVRDFCIDVGMDEADAGDWCAGCLAKYAGGEHRTTDTQTTRK